MQQKADRHQRGRHRRAPGRHQNRDLAVLAQNLRKVAQEKDENSCLNYFRKMVKLRKDNEVLVYGKFTSIDKNNPDVFAYTRELNGTKMLVLLNFRSKEATVNTGIDISKAKLLIGNYNSALVATKLRPYEAIIYEL